MRSRSGFRRKRPSVFCGKRIKALSEMEANGLTEMDTAESILKAVAIYKTIRSQSP
jgi:hypothetical protein